MEHIHLQIQSLEQRPEDSSAGYAAQFPFGSSRVA